MAIHAKMEKYWERFYPGVIARVRLCGPGSFTDEGGPRIWPKGSNGIAGIRLSLEYHFEDRHTLRIVRSERADDTGLGWHRIHYVNHYGDLRGETHFRFDLDAMSGHHVCLKTEPDENHIASADCVPDVTNISPIEFVEMVDTYRKTGHFPIARKGTR